MNQVSKHYDYQKGWAVNPDAPQQGTVDDKAPYIDNGTDIFEGLEHRYADPDYAREEFEKLWAKVWIAAGREKDIPDVGDYFKYDIAGESFIIVRASEGENGIRAFYNVCQHRGNRLVTADFGSVKTFKCMFHSWEWEIDGTLKNIQDAETFRPEVIADNPPMAEVHCDTWGGFVFINMDENPHSLHEQLGIIPEHLKDFRFEDMVVVKDVETVWDANWKTGVDAFIESYHVHGIHPEIMSILDEYYQQYDCYPHGNSRMLAPFARQSPRNEDQTELNEGLKQMLREVEIDPDTFEGDARDVRKAVADAKRIYAKKWGMDFSALTDSQLTDDWNYTLFPNATLNIHAEGALFMNFRPHPTDTEKLIYNIKVLALPHGDPNYMLPYYMGVERGADLTGKTRPPRIYEEPFGENVGFVLNQDAALVPLVQEGQKSRGFGGARYSEQEVRLRHFHLELDKYMTGKKDAEWETRHQEARGTVLSGQTAAAAAE